MAQPEISKKLSEEELFFYEDQMCAESDAVYRFCIGLCLGQDQALKLLRKAYKHAAADIGSLINLGGLDLRAALFAYAYQDMKNESASSSGDSPLFRFMKKLPIEQRAIAVAREVCGLTFEQTAKVVGLAVGDVLQKCASTRKELRVHMNQSVSE